MTPCPDPTTPTRPPSGTLNIESFFPTFPVMNPVRFLLPALAWKLCQLFFFAFCWSDSRRVALYHRLANQIAKFSCYGSWLWIM